MRVRTPARGIDAVCGTDDGGALSVAARAAPTEKAVGRAFR